MPNRETTGRVLLAEDSLVGQRVAVAMLEHLGHAVDVVADGADAVRAAVSADYLAVLMDCRLPVLDGYQATAEIRRLQGTSRRTPIIAVTGSATESDRQRCLAAGMDDCLPKPLRLTSLTAVLARCAENRPAPLADLPAARLLAEASDPDWPTDPERPVLDARVIDRLQRLGEASGKGLVGQLAVMFSTVAEVELVAMRAAITAGDAAAVGRSAHALSGASANLGARALAGLCSALSRRGASGDLADGGHLIDTLEAELDRVRIALSALVPTS